MALKASAPVWGYCGRLQLGKGDLGPRSFGFSLNWRTDAETSFRKWEPIAVLGVSSAQRALTPVEEESSSSRTDTYQIESSRCTELQKESASLPRPLSITDLLSSSSGDSSNIRVAYKGVPGAYSEAAALKAYPQCEAVPCDEIEDALKAVELWLVKKAILPIESSIDGSVHRNYDLLLRHKLHIVGEVQMAVNHCLMGLPGVRKEDIKRVLSHPQALSQCEVYLSKLGVVKEGVDSTAGAAQFVASNRQRDAGAVASARAAEIYGLNILAEKIQDDADNITRFLILAREPIIPNTGKPFKTSVVFTLEEGPGVLFKALAVFALREINLTKIESRPQRKRPLRVVDDSTNGSAMYFDYLFYIDFEASMAEPRAQYALGHLQVVPNTRSRSQMGETTDGGLYEIFQQDFGPVGSPSFEAARDNFIISAAGYAVASLILQPKDRHNGNLLFDNVGRLVHIDFGFIFEISPGGNMRFESADFKLSHEMTQLLDPSGVMKSETWFQFVSLCVKGYLAARRYMDGIINTVLMMVDSGLPCFSRGDAIVNLRKRFHPEMSEREAANFMIRTCTDAYNKWTTAGYDLIQYLQQGIEK